MNESQRANRHHSGDTLIRYFVSALLTAALEHHARDWRQVSILFTLRRSPSDVSSRHRLLPNFHEIPINAPVAEVHNNQRDGMHRQAIARGRVSYEPNSLASGCPFQAGMRGFTSFPSKPDTGRAAAHPSSAPLRAVESAGTCRSAAGRRNIARNIDEDLAEGVAADLGMELPERLPLAIKPRKPEVPVSSALSLLARPGDGSIRTRRIGILVADVANALVLHAGLIEAGAVPRYVGARLGPVLVKDGDAESALPQFIAAIAKHRRNAREIDALPV